MRLIRAAVAAATVAAGMFAADAAYADSFDAWQRHVTDKGCYSFEYGISVGGMESDPNRDGYVWSGSCTAGSPINGQGTLYVQVQYPFSDGTVMRQIRAYTGRMVNGFWEGPVAQANYDVDESGRWNPNAPTPIEFGPGVVQFIRGCPEWSIDPSSEWACRPGQVTDPINIPQVSPPYYGIPGLNPTEADPVISDGTQYATSPGMAAPQPTGTASDSANVWGTCVALEGPEQSGIQQIYYLRNRCQSKVTVAFCLWAEFEAAGNDWAMCSSREYKVFDIRSGDRIHFPFSLTPPGTAMSNGVIVGENGLHISGVACANGGSPSVYVENKELMFQHC